MIIAALKAARRVNDFPTAVRIFEGTLPTSSDTALSYPLCPGLTKIPLPGIKAKVENKQQYQQYLDELKDLREEMGVALVEDLYPESK